MRAVVISESSFGNTASVAAAIGAGLARSAEVRVVEVSDAPPDLGDVDLVVVGGPTHAFGMSRRSTREDAARQATGDVVSRGTGIREWLATQPVARNGVDFATFDTRVTRVRRLPGSAAKAAARALKRVGHRQAAPPKSFYVHDVKGPLADGELDRAQAWGDNLGSNLAARAAHTGAGTTNDVAAT